MSGTGDSTDEGDDKHGPDADRQPDAVPRAGVLGNLPKTRPSVRSPRREAQKPQQGSGPAPSEPAEPRRPPRVESEEKPERPAAEPSTGGGNDLDALARGGIAIAGEAASLGLRIAGRAAAALRDAVERR